MEKRHSERRELKLLKGMMMMEVVKEGKGKKAKGRERKSD